MRSVSLLLPILLSTLAALPAVAQPLRAESPTQNVYNPTTGLTGFGDASSLVKNPALLSTLRSWSLVYFHTERPGDRTVGGRGDAAFFALPVPLLSAFSFGLGLQSVRPPQAFPFSSTIKLSTALAWRPMRLFSAGLAYSYVYRRARDGSVGSTHTVDLGLNANINRLFAFGMTIRDLGAPSVYGAPLQRVYDLEAAYRPWGNDRMEIALGTRIGERRRDVDPHFRVWLTPAQGFHLKADVEWRRDVELDGNIDNDVRAALGLELDLDSFSIGGYGLFGRELGESRGQGFSLVARAHGERHLPPWQTPLHLEKIVLDKALSPRALTSLVRRLREIEGEPLTKGVLVELRNFDGGWGTAETLRASLERLKVRKKRVFVSLRDPSTRAYYVATAGERLFLHPGGGVALKGLHSTVTFFAGTGELLGVRADFVKIGAYKSAPEQYTEKAATAAAREQRNAYLDEIHRHLTDGIAAGRKVDAAMVRRWIDGGPYTAGEAKRLGLVDELVTDSQLGKAVDQALGRHLAIVPTSERPRHPYAFVPTRVAVLAVDGEITDGESLTIPLLDKKLVGAKTLLAAIEAVQKSASIKALVVYLDTPGGSALASDLVAEALRELRQHKPVVCVMNDVAASGGYYLASACEKIYALPSTLTGSIGIFTGKFDISGLAGKLGVTHETYERGKQAGIDSMWRPYTEEERALLADKLRYYYDRFVDAVAEGRSLDRGAVDRLGQGRVWAGSAAKERGLVDELGGVGEALDWAFGETGFRAHEVELHFLPEEKPLLFTLLGLVGFDLKAQTPALPLLQPLLRALPGSLLVAPSQPQARLEWDEWNER